MQREGEMAPPAYSPARAAALAVRPQFAAAREAGDGSAAALPELEEIQWLIEAAFWASLRREEGYYPKISLAFVPPETRGGTLALERPLPLAAESLVRLAGAVERPGIHLGVWRDEGQLLIWGATRKIPPFCFVLEVVAPGLLVIKHRRGESSGKFVNVAVLEGDQVKVLDLDAAVVPGCRDLLSALLGFDAAAASSESVNALVELAVSMRAHGRGGTLLVAPGDSDAWRESMVHPMRYALAPPFSRLADLMREEHGRRNGRGWQESLHSAVETIAGLTAVDGATVINDRYEVLAFGVKIRRRDGFAAVEQVIVTEPIQGAPARAVPAVETGGTRHISAAQFAHDQRDILALVASQDGRFTVFEWSPCEDAVHAHRVETLLL